MGRISEAHAWILNGLIDESRLVRLLEQRVYPIEEFFDDLRLGIWSELDASREVDPYRAALQRTYVEVVAERLHHSAVIRAYARGELNVLNSTIEKTLLNVHLDRATRFHLEDVRQQINRALDPKFPPPAPSPRPETPSFPLRVDNGLCAFDQH